MQQAFLLDTAALDYRAVVRRAFWRDAICFVINAARARVQSRRRAVDDGKLVLTRLRSECRLHTQVGVAVRFRRLTSCSPSARRSL